MDETSRAEVNEIQQSRRGIFPMTFIREISYVFIQYYANAALCTPAIQSVVCVSPIETINTLLLQLGSILQVLCESVCAYCVCV